MKFSILIMATAMIFGLTLGVEGRGHGETYTYKKVVDKVETTETVQRVVSQTIEQVDQEISNVTEARANAVIECQAKDDSYSDYLAELTNRRNTF